MLESCDFIEWLLTSFPQYDEEIVSLHVPVILDYILSNIQVCTEYSSRTPAHSKAG